MTKLKGYKVTNTSRTKTCGVASSSLKDLKSKACSKFEVTNSDDFNFLLLDGTIVDTEEYFATLAPQTLLIFSNRNDNVSTGADIIYNALKSINIDVLRAGDSIRLFLDDNIKDKIRTLSDCLITLGDAEDKTLLTSAKDHPEWFQGLQTNCTNKEDFLKRRCKDRINGYFYKVKADLRKSCQNSEEKYVLDTFISRLKKKLQSKDYMSGYFDRRDKIKLCDNNGQFTCFGLWNKEKCLYIEKRTHTINPYRSSEERTVFSTWNLDHRIEKSRTIIPCIKTAIKTIVKNPIAFEINHELIFDLLFTSENLRLVHIVCHDKGAHTTATLDLEKVILKRCNGF